MIEDLVRILPESVAFLRKRKIRCIACGEPIWGSLVQAAEKKGLDEKEITEIVNELNRMLLAHHSGQ